MSSHSYMLLSSWIPPNLPHISNLLFMMENKVIYFFLKTLSFLTIKISLVSLAHVLNSLLVLLISKTYFLFHEMTSWIIHFLSTLQHISLLGVTACHLESNHTIQTLFTMVYPSLWTKLCFSVKGKRFMWSEEKTEYWNTEKLF